jgi:hypothetical protein
VGSARLLWQPLPAPLRHVPADAARAKLRAMTTAAAAVRDRIQKEKNA